MSFPIGPSEGQIYKKYSNGMWSKISGLINVSQADYNTTNTVATFTTGSTKKPTSEVITYIPDSDDSKVMATISSSYKLDQTGTDNDISVELFTYVLDESLTLVNTLNGMEGDGSSYIGIINVGETSAQLFHHVTMRGEVVKGSDGVYRIQAMAQGRADATSGYAIAATAYTHTVVWEEYI